MRKLLTTVSLGLIFSLVMCSGSVRARQAIPPIVAANTLGPGEVEIFTLDHNLVDYIKLKMLFGVNLGWERTTPGYDPPQSVGARDVLIRFRPDGKVSTFVVSKLPETTRGELPVTFELSIYPRP